MVLLIDGRYLCYRARYAYPSLTWKDDEQQEHSTGVLYGFLRQLEKLLVIFRGCPVILWDSKPTARRKIYARYKENRQDDGAEDFNRHISEVVVVVRHLGVCQIQAKGWEADDLMATISQRCLCSGERVIMVSRDKDLWQLLRDEKVMLWDGEKLITEREFRARWHGLSPEKWAQVQALAGDSVDNILGVKGIGVQTAAKLFVTYGTLPEIRDKALSPKLRKGLGEFSDEDFERNLKLVTLKGDLKEEEDYYVIKPEPSLGKVMGLLTCKGIRSISPELYYKIQMRRISL